MKGKLEYVTRSGAVLLNEVDKLFNETENEIIETKYGHPYILCLAESHVYGKLNSLVSELEHFSLDNLFSCYVFGNNGWCTPFGEISHFGTIGKWPSSEEVFTEWSLIAKEFEFLDLNVTVFENKDDMLKLLFNVSVKNGTANIEEPNLDVHGITMDQLIGDTKYDLYRSVDRYPTQELYDLYSSTSFFHVSQFLEELSALDDGISSKVKHLY